MSTRATVQPLRRHSGGIGIGTVLYYLGLWVLFLSLSLAALGALGFALWVFQFRADRTFTNRIYPHVFILGEDLGGLTLEEAALRLNQLPSPGNNLPLVLRDGANQWTYTPDQAGLQVDLNATLQAAYAVGRNDEFPGQLSAWILYHNIPPYYTTNPALVRPLLEALAPQISQPPVDASFKLENDHLAVVPGQAGRILDIEATLARLQTSPATALGIEVPLLFKIITPADPDPSVRTQAEAFLQRTITASTYDILTDKSWQWKLDRPVIAGWLRLIPQENGTVTITIAPEAVQKTLLGLAAQTGEGMGFRIEEATHQITTTFQAGGGAVNLYLTHPERTYTVQSGDSISSIATRLGMPSGLIIQANPNINPNQLQVNQVITIPSQDLLTPYLPVAGKKIVVSLKDQRMRVYENGQLIHEWVVSTGLATSPTLPGHFQILSKKENAYASQWDLWMPNFMAVYPAGGDVYNGIHELPILSNGQRLWSGNLGHPASFGCIILGIQESNTLFQWAEMGVPVIIE